MGSEPVQLSGFPPKWKINHFAIALLAATMVVVAVKANGAPVPGLTEKGAGTTRWTPSDARGGSCTGLGRGAGCGAAGGAAVGRQASGTDKIVRPTPMRTTEKACLSIPVSPTVVPASSS